MADFVRDMNDARRVVIVDVSGIFYRFAFGEASSFCC